MRSDQFAAFNTAQIASLASSEIYNLNSSQLAVLNSLQICAFTSDQVSQIEPTLVSTYLDSKTPLVLDLNGDGIQTLSASQGVIFDVNNDGKVEKTGWAAGTDGLLVRDLNGDGQINDGGELFGEGTVLADGSKAKDGYAALRALDSNLDGLINANDAAFNQLLVWTDLNSDGKANSCELASLSDMSRVL